MSDPIATMTAERARLHRKSLSARVIQNETERVAGTARLQVKDSRSQTGGENQLYSAQGVTPGTWVTFATAAASQAVFV